MVTLRTVYLERLLDTWDGEVVAPAGLDDLMAAKAGTNFGAATHQLASLALAALVDIPALLASGAAPDGRAAGLARRLGWTVQMLRDWDPRVDPSGLMLEAALASAAPWDEAGAFWDAARDRLAERAFVRALPLVLGCRAVQTGIRDDARAHEREALANFARAEEEGDWVRLAEIVSSFMAPTPDVGAAQAALALSRLDWRALVGLADAARGWGAAWLLIGALPLVDVCRLATASASRHLRFAVLERVVVREVRPLSAAEELAFSQLLISLSTDRERWPSWLAILNAHPVRAPHVQTAVGRALSRLSDDALAAYASSVPLDSSGSELRDQLTDALRVFRSRAPAARRLVLWARCHERWLAWNFAADEGRGLADVATCSLDYGVVGWLVEDGDGDPDDPEVVFAARARELDLEWHGSFSEAASAFLRLVSRHQVLVHAALCVTSGADWLPVGPVKVPVAAKAFVRARYGWASPR